MTRPSLPLCAAALIFLLSGAASLSALSRWSLTFDEITYTPAGYDYLRTGRIRFNREKGPLAKALAALPLLALAPDPPVPKGDERGFRTGWDFYFRNKIPAPRLAFYSRLASTAAGLLLAGVFFFWARELFGPGPALAALAFLLLDPMFRALSRLALPDIFLALFLLEAFRRLYHAADTGVRTREAVLAGLAAGAAAACKLSGLLFYPAATLLLLLVLGRRRGIKTLGIILAGSAAAIAVIYHLNLPLFFHGLLNQAVSMKDSPASFFFGRTAVAAWPHYYLASIPLKTPYPLLAVLGLGIPFWVLAPQRRSLLWAAVALLLFFAAASANRFYATRYLYSIFPLMLLAAAAAWHSGGPRVRVLVAVLLLWQSAETVLAYPHYLSYMNPPWRAAGHRYLANSDFDWGQGLPALADYWENAGRPPLQLCYFGTAQPEAYGIRAQELTTVPGLPASTRVLGLSPAKELLAVSAGCRQFMTLSPPGAGKVRAWGWLEDRVPARVLGRTIFLYDIRDDAHAHGRLGQLHFYQGETAKALREARRVLEIAPGDRAGRAFLSAVEERMRFTALAPPEDGKK